MERQKLVTNIEGATINWALPKGPMTPILQCKLQSIKDDLEWGNIRLDIQFFFGESWTLKVLVKR